MGLSSLTKAAIEGFSGNQDSKERRNAYVEFISYLLAFILAMIILGFIGKWLWNGVIVDLFSFAKPARSVWDIIGLMIFTTLIIPK
jgi:hypothetical protein